MARHEIVSLTKGVPVQLTNASAAVISFQVKSGAQVFVAGTTDTTPPALGAPAWEYSQGQGEIGAALADLFPGVSGVTRVWAWFEDGEDVRVMVSHA